MATEHRLLRDSIESVEETTRLLARYNKRNNTAELTREDLFALRSAATMAHQASRSLSELSGYLEAKLYNSGS